MHIRAPAIVCSARPHGENAAIARLMTADHGLVAGYVAGGRGRRMRPVLIPGNRVEADIASRSASQLPFLKAELVTSRAPFLSEPLPAAAIVWITALTAAVLPERSPFPALYQALDAVLDAICHAPSARGWVPALIACEALFLRELGFGGARPDLAGADWARTMEVFDISGRHVEKRLLADRAGPVMGELVSARAILRDRLSRIA
ncbi:DNA repair protein RecO [Croceicoccus marinus]|uniref:DNA recombination protein RecO n=1 Tax=Croceicoccus marinus TaxID=450378 RepID=A0A1Z1F9T0_9SPHN|nr:recombination protein O N-terminal domain-containing protein [Croceicoccus marinus]ARU15486.1 DNA recombination protein RecO [Croceicoccus marinus]